MQACRLVPLLPIVAVCPRLNFTQFVPRTSIVCIMGVGTQVIIVMFDDNKITVTTQCVTGIYDAPIGGCDDSLSLTACNVDPLLPPSEAPKKFSNRFAIRRSAMRKSARWLTYCLHLVRSLTLPLVPLQAL